MSYEETVQAMQAFRSLLFDQTPAVRAACKREGITSLDAYYDHLRRVDTAAHEKVWLRGQGGLILLPEVEARFGAPKTGSGGVAPVGVGSPPPASPERPRIVSYADGSPYVPKGVEPRKPMSDQDFLGMLSEVRRGV